MELYYDLASGSLFTETGHILHQEDHHISRILHLGVFKLRPVHT